MQKKTIIYIMSDVRSGSTLLENILSNSPDIVSVGELHHLNSYLYKGKTGEKLNWECSCGKLIKKCDFWSKVIGHLNEKGTNTIQQTEVIKKQGFRFFNTFSEIKLPENKEIIKNIDNIYDSIFEVSDKKIIVDSSKNEIQLALLLKYSKFDIKVIYLKRDIRAVVLSKKKWEEKFNKNKKHIYERLLTTKLKYSNQNKVFNKFVKKGNGLKINYAVLAKDMPVTLLKIIKFTDIGYFEPPEFMEMENNHSIGGTPNREKRRINYDNSWKKEVAKKPLFRLMGKIIDII